MALLKNEVKAALEVKDFGKVADLARHNSKVFSILISLSYDKEDLMTWRAIEAMGIAADAVTEVSLPTVRNVIQRLLWSLGEESGGIGWSAAEMLGEIATRRPKEFADIPPIILSFHEEEMFRNGVLWAMGRIAEAGAVVVKDADTVAAYYLTHHDPATRGIAAWATGRLRGASWTDKLRDMVSDQGELRLYENREIVCKTVGGICREVLHNVLHAD